MTGGAGPAFQETGHHGAGHDGARIRAVSTYGLVRYGQCGTGQCGTGQCYPKQGITGRGRVIRPQGGRGSERAH
jgi:hypothetical protein